MELEVKDDTFYLLDTGKEKRIYDTENEAVTSLQKTVSSQANLNPETVTIWKVNTSGEKWEIKSVPWSRIAIELMKGRR
ncbi:MAG: hypothetical protein PVH73_06715 [Candidatus Bathyarchaeota archaeon]|jgi:hypothetical protein